MLEKAMTPEEIVDYLRSIGFAPGFDSGRTSILKSDLKALTCRMVFSEKGKRLGGTINGPAQFIMADAAMYYTVIGTIGPKAGAATTSMTINFLRAPKGEVLIGECRLLRVGRTLITGDVLIYLEGEDEPVAHATGSYAVPRRQTA